MERCLEVKREEKLGSRAFERWVQGWLKDETGRLGQEEKHRQQQLVVLPRLRVALRGLLLQATAAFALFQRSAS